MQCGRTCELARDAKVADLDRAGGGQQHIGSLDVAVDALLIVQVDQRMQHLLQHVRNRRLLQRTLIQLRIAQRKSLSEPTLLEQGAWQGRQGDAPDQRRMQT